MMYETPNLSKNFHKAHIEGNGQTQFSFFGTAPRTLLLHLAACAECMTYTHVWIHEADDNDMAEFEATADEKFMHYCFAMIDAHNEHSDGH